MTFKEHISVIPFYGFAATLLCITTEGLVEYPIEVILTATGITWVLWGASTLIKKYKEK